MPSQVMFHHMHLCCQDPQAAARWFEEMLGAKTIGEATFFGGAPGLRLDLNGTYLYIRGLRPGEHLSEDSTRDRFGYDHLGLKVSDIEEVAGRMQAKGVEFEVDVHEPRPGTRIAFIRGPEHIRIELIESKA
jgi:lactoylglutathione lyase